jgi:predicted RNA-binding Zn-ribbon protein involved in translation (DUF1610 family)
MNHDESCGCDHLRLDPASRDQVEDCPRCGAVTWTGDGPPAEKIGEALTCPACGGRVVAWMGERKVTTLRRCLSCDEVVALTV